MWIDREEALSFPFANGKYDKENANKDFIAGCESYREYLEGLSIKNLGSWLYDKNECRFICSACGEWAIERIDLETEETDSLLTDFCPHCGADMRNSL